MSSSTTNNTTDVTSQPTTTNSNPNNSQSESLPDVTDELVYSIITTDKYEINDEKADVLGLFCSTFHAKLNLLLGLIDQYPQLERKNICVLTTSNRVANDWSNYKFKTLQLTKGNVDSQLDEHVTSSTVVVFDFIHAKQQEIWDKLVTTDLNVKIVFNPFPWVATTDRYMVKHFTFTHFLLHPYVERRVVKNCTTMMRMLNESSLFYDHYHIKDAFAEMTENQLLCFSNEDGYDCNGVVTLPNKFGKLSN